MTASTSPWSLGSESSTRSHFRTNRSHHARYACVSLDVHYSGSQAHAADARFAYVALTPFIAVIAWPGSENGIPAAAGRPSTFASTFCSARSLGEAEVGITSSLHYSSHCEYGSGSTRILTSVACRCSLQARFR